jgi:hypothetical protein
MHTDEIVRTPDNGSRGIKATSVADWRRVDDCADGHGTFRRLNQIWLGIEWFQPFQKVFRDRRPAPVWAIPREMAARALLKGNPRTGTIKTGQSPVAPGELSLTSL